MDYTLSSSTVKQLKEWGCDIEIVMEHKLGEKSKYIRDIICDGEMAKQFFGERYTEYLVIAVGEHNYEYDDPAYIVHSKKTTEFLQENNNQKAEEHLLEHCVFNPNNKS